MDPFDRVGVEWPGIRLQQIMALSAGTRLGHYDVTALLGEGGMGNMWRHVVRPRTSRVADAA